MSRGCRPEPVPAKAGAGMTGWARTVPDLTRLFLGVA
jgi:hypothetical protein